MVDRTLKSNYYYCSTGHAHQIIKLSGPRQQLEENSFGMQTALSRSAPEGDKKIKTAESLVLLTLLSLT